MARSRKRITRRAFIKSAAAAGAVLTLPGWVGGCGDDGSSHRGPAPTPGPTPLPGPERERRTLHFDLSGYDQEATYRLSIKRSRSDNAKLSRHTAATRAEFRHTTPFLNSIPDDHLTHYLESVDASGNAIQLVFVHMDTQAAPGFAVVSTFLTFPTSALTNLAESNRSAVAAGTSPYAAYAKLRAYGIAPAVPDGIALPELDGDPVSTVIAIADFLTPMDAGKAVIFFLPELTNLDPMQGVLVGQHIDMTDSLPATGASIVEQGPATTAGGWMTLVPYKTQPTSTTNYDYIFSDATLQQMRDPMLSALRATKNDPALEGANWSIRYGNPSVQQQSDSAGLLAGPFPTPPTPVCNPSQGQAMLGLSYPAGSDTSWIHGVGFDGIDVTTEGNTRTVAMEFSNIDLRYLGVSLQNFDVDGNLIPGPPPPAVPYPLPGNFQGYLPPATSVLGIPIAAKLSINFEIPNNAVRTLVTFGALGQDAFKDMATAAFTEAPTILTGVVNYGIPTMMALAGVGLASTAAIAGSIGAQAFTTGLLTVAADVVEDVINNAIANQELSIGDILKQLATFIGEIMLSVVEFKAAQAVSEVFAVLKAILAVEEVADDTPVSGWAMRLLGQTISAVDLGQTLIESLTTPALWANELTLVFDMQVEIHGDPRNAGLIPAEAASYTVFARYSQKVIRTISNPIGADASPFSVTFNCVPEGGTVQVEVMFYNASGWVAGYGTATPGPVPNFETNVGQLTITITECTPPLSQTTQYVHVAKTALVEQNGLEGLEWQTVGNPHPTPPPAPTATLTSLNCAQGVAGLCELVGITVAQTVAHVGYAWRAGGLAVQSCDNNGASELYVFQDIYNYGEATPNFVPCGFARRPGIVYDLLGPANGVGDNFFLQPGFDPNTNEPRVYVRQTLVTTGMPGVKFDLQQTTSFGSFSQSPDSVAVHPGGYVVGLNRSSCFLEYVVIANDGPVPDADAAPAYIKAGRGTRVGLLDDPVAMTVALTGEVIVLDAGNLRLHAFDVFGNPAPSFGGQAVFPLRAQGEDVTYLDVAVDAAGYLYVLYFLGDGDIVADYALDIYGPDLKFVTQTVGIAAGKMAIDTFRSLYTLNYEELTSATGAAPPQPSVSIWVPSEAGNTPSCSPTATPTPTTAGR